MQKAPLWVQTNNLPQFEVYTTTRFCVRAVTNIHTHITHTHIQRLLSFIERCSNKVTLTFPYYSIKRGVLYIFITTTAFTGIGFGADLDALLCITF